MSPRLRALLRGRQRRAATAVVVALLLAGCAAPPHRPETAPAGDVRTGRLALAVQDQPGQSFSAAFELRGRPEAGELTLLNPLGGTVAVLRWQPGEAVLSAQGREPQRFPSVDAMVEQATGSALPLGALFDWLAGIATPVPGWEADLTALHDGRLRAQRKSPPPQADLRVVLDR
ncbi:MAG TPA: outer membrane lipoprotein LolB [Ramlibacter sp.]|jgi:outer membrane lipoprotein LolB|uniref:outer membrane lipoprotein LolB n=1 Tax=Ramlibacter sp. TaxID=1917967 RepID=UPI002D3570E9|nr:outer membrane lipoprotein LolB [Ramlibacter sp.]HZY19934.1 outer membrane lipoprotein LolB [Ramlibacter sp.]